MLQDRVSLPVFRAVTPKNISTWRMLKIKWPNSAAFPLNLVSLAKRKTGHDAIPAADSGLTLFMQLSTVWVLIHTLDLFYFMGYWQPKASQAFSTTSLRVAIPSEHPTQRERGQCSPHCLLSGGTVKTGSLRAKRWLQAFTCTGICTRAIQALILFPGLKIFPLLLCNISLSSGDGSISFSCPITHSSPCSQFIPCSNPCPVSISSCVLSCSFGMLSVVCPSAWYKAQECIYIHK